MKLTRATTYALDAVAYLAGSKKDLTIASHTIARARGISEKFLLKVLKPLVSARVLISTKGPHGGYRLAKAAIDITFLEVLEAVEGPLRGLAPNGDPKHPISRRLDAICQQSAEQMRKHLGRIKVTELLGKD